MCHSSSRSVAMVQGASPTACHSCGRAGALPVRYRHGLCSRGNWSCAAAHARWASPFARSRSRLPRLIHARSARLTAGVVPAPAYAAGTPSLPPPWFRSSARNRHLSLAHRLGTNRKSDRYRPAQRQSPPHPISPQAELTVIVFVVRFQQRLATRAHDPLADVYHPHPGDRQRQDQVAQSGWRQCTALQIEASTLEVAIGRLNPEPFAPAAPGMAVSRLIQDPIARRLFLGVPINDQIDRTKGVLLGQDDLLHIAPPSALDRDGAQGLPDFVGVLVQAVTFDPHMPVPVPLLTELLQLDSPKLGISKEGDTDLFWIWQQRLDTFEQLDLTVSRRAAIGQYVPGQQHHPLVGGNTNPQEADAFVQVGAIHHQGQFDARPVGEELGGQGTIVPLPGEGRCFEPTTQALDEILALALDGQDSRQRRKMTVGTLGQRQDQQGQIEPQRGTSGWQQ